MLSEPFFRVLNRDMVTLLRAPALHPRISPAVLAAGAKWYAYTQHWPLSASSATKLHATTVGGSSCFCHDEKFFSATQHEGHEGSGGTSSDKIYETDF
jgi:hypothetical protein